jgi:hypothetical protein
MRYAVEMGSGAMIHIPSSIKIGSGIQKLRGDTHKDTQTHTNTQTARTNTMLLLCLHYKESGLKIKSNNKFVNDIA